jgi:hypothetical protein
MFKEIFTDNARTLQLSTLLIPTCLRDVSEEHLQSPRRPQGVTTEKTSTSSLPRKTQISIKDGCWSHVATAIQIPETWTYTRILSSYFFPQVLLNTRPHFVWSLKRMNHAEEVHSLLENFSSLSWPYNFRNKLINIHTNRQKYLRFSLIEIISVRCMYL